MHSCDPFSEFRELFSRCNLTELYQIAREGGHVVQPNFSKEALIEIIIGAEQPPLTPNDLDEWRKAIIRFLLDHRRVLETQISCPARVLYAPDSVQRPTEEVVDLMRLQDDACFGCVDAQVVNCMTSNGEDNLRLIRLRKKT